jgi:hypothetical protein
MGYIDLCHLTGRQIKMDEDGLIWLDVNRQKTVNVSNMPLLEVPLQLFEKYGGIIGSNDKIFPMKSNSQMKNIFAAIQIVVL